MKQKILAIDDSLTLREFIQRCLAKQSADYQIVLAKDGKEGLSLAAREMPDLILLDFVLPDMKGDEVCRRLQADAKTAGLPVVLMSSLTHVVIVCSAKTAATAATSTTSTSLAC